MLEKILHHLKEEINKTFMCTQPIDMPGLAVIVNNENESLVNCVNMFKKDCEDIRFNWFLTNINSKTDEDFIKRMINDYNEMEDVTMIIVLLPLPDHLNHLASELTELCKTDKYGKLNTIELIGESSTGSRIAVLNNMRIAYYKK